MGDFLAIGMIVGGMGLCWLYAVAIHRGMSDAPEAKP
jgi:hypothetical protein